jgi:CDP-paratose 2-epimerase
MTGARSLYGFTKLAAENIIEEYRASFGLKAIVNRCGVIAGPWQFGKVDQGVLALWVMAHYFSRPLSYVGYGGTGKQVRDLLHIRDLCELICEQVAEPAAWDGWVGNVSGGRSNSASLAELTSHCAEVLGRSIRVERCEGARPFDLRIFIGNCARLFARTSWRPHASVKRIVEDTAAWVRQHEREIVHVLG